jgi:hypothetical protein
MRARRGTPLRKSARANQRVWGSSTFSFWRANLEGGVEPSLHLYRYDLPSQRGSCGRRISSAGSPSNAFASRYSVLGRVLLSPVSNKTTVAGLIPASCARSACVQSRLARSITIRSASGDRGSSPRLPSSHFPVRRVNQQIKNYHRKVRYNISHLNPIAMRLNTIAMRGYTVRGLYQMRAYLRRHTADHIQPVRAPFW